MPEQEWELPSGISNSTLRRVQQALDRDFRVAIDNNRADRRAGRGLAGGLKAPNTRAQTRQIRAGTAALVNDRLKEGWFGPARVALNWLLRRFRRSEGREAAPTADHRGDYPAPDHRGQYGAADHRGQYSAPDNRGEYSAASEHRRRSLTSEQVERWKEVLATAEPDAYEKRVVESAIAAAYLVAHNRDLQQLYQKDPREMQSLAEIIVAADRIADQYPPRPTNQSFGPPPQPAFGGEFMGHRPVASATPSPQQNGPGEWQAREPAVNLRSTARAAAMTTVTRSISAASDTSRDSSPTRRDTPRKSRRR
ncbi:hypothetical protein ACQPYA_16510 [Micromonospora sp. CA-263727]|uniref:hypothetical protein n=1 Tax=Micromonospora sp. CA-263727 TaxID=3239967 RepID=UPI003D91A55D